MEETSYFLGLIDLYGLAFGQKLNNQKPLMFFSANMPDNLRRSLMEVMSVLNLGGLDKYLGLPSPIGKARIKAFIFLCES